MSTQSITNLLPSCHRCKRLRRRCDTLLPSCRPCTKAKAECTFHDNSLQQSLPRSYVQSLLTRLEQLKAAQTAAQGLVDIFQSNNVRPPMVNQLVRTETSPREQLSSKTTSYDVHCPIESSETPTLRYFGSSSAMALTVELLAQVYSDGHLIPAAKTVLYFPPPERISRAYCQPIISLLHKDALVPLVQLYQSSLNLIYPFMDEMVVEADLNCVLHGQHPETPGSSILTGTEAYQYFRITMLCANACAVKSRHEPHFVAIGDAYYNEASRHVEEVTSEVCGESLQALLLLIVYCLFHPQKGDIWKLLDFACRLSMELGYHREQAIDPNNPLDERQRGLRRSCFWSLYTIERIVGQLFGRTSDLPEPIITTDYPDHTNNREDVMTQLTSATHHHRLVYLRSEIYRHMYLPTSPPPDGLDWFEAQFFTLLQWHHDLDLDHSPPGVSTITCTVAYHATIIFLFQPLVLRAISVKDAADKITIPSDNYFSACKLLYTYEEVLQAPENSTLGAYPMTFMSAHYIYLAGLTLMAHCLIHLNGCVTVPPPWTGNGAPDSPGISFHNLLESSGSCLVLLTWCSEKWRGMSGMLDTYKRLSETLIPLMMQKSTILA